MRLLLILAMTAAFGMLLSALMMPVAAPKPDPTEEFLRVRKEAMDSLAATVDKMRKDYEATVAPAEAEMVPVPIGGRYPDNAPIRGCDHRYRAYTLIYPGPNSSTCLQCGKRFAPGE